MLTPDIITPRPQPALRAIAIGWSTVGGVSGSLLTKRTSYLCSMRKSRKAVSVESPVP
jgi:hypothetical protein